MMAKVLVALQVAVILAVVGGIVWAGENTKSNRHITVLCTDPLGTTPLIALSSPELKRVVSTKVGVKLTHQNGSTMTVVNMPCVINSEVIKNDN